MYGFAILATALTLLISGVVVLLRADPIEGVRARRMAAVLSSAGRRQGAFETALLAQQEAAARRSAELANLSDGRARFWARQREIIRQVGLGRIPMPLYCMLLLALGRVEAALAVPPAMGALGTGQDYEGLMTVGFTVVSALFLHFGLVRGLALFLEGRRRARALAKLPEALDMVVRSLRTGRNPAEAFAAAASESSGPLKEELDRALGRVRLGQSLESALREAGDRLGLNEIGMAATAVSIAGATGGSLAEALSNLSSTLRERRQFVMEVKALTAEGRFSAWIIGSLPFVMFFLVLLVSPEHAAPLIYDPRGNKILMFAGGLVLLGILVLRKITRIRF